MQCQHTRKTGVLSMHRCERKATKDGYCTRHHSSYVSPKDSRALQDLESREAERAKRMVRAVMVARAYLEPHRSNVDQELRYQALVAIEDALGASDPAFQDVYDKARDLLPDYEGDMS